MREDDIATIIQAIIILIVGIAWIGVVCYIVKIAGLLIQYLEKLIG